MSGLVRCQLIRFYKHVKTCLEILKSPIQIDTILQTYQDFFEVPKPLMQIDTLLQTCPDL